MTRLPRPAPPWLADLQMHFGTLLRTPLDRASGTLTATIDAYPPELTADASGARLAVYQRQYWFRLLDVVQEAFPLTARLLGFWTFNDFAARYLTAHPPVSWDIDRVADGFADAFTRDPAAGKLPDFLTLSEAAWLDTAYRDVFRAPSVPPFRPTAADAPRLLRSRLLLSPALRIVREHAPLVALRQRVMSDPASSRAESPPPHPAARAWAIFRPNGQTPLIQALPLDPEEADLLRLLHDHPLEDALARLESAHLASTAGELAARAALPERTRGWLAHAVERGFFVGLADDARESS